MGLDMFLEKNQRCDLNELVNVKMSYEDTDWESDEVQALEKLAKESNNFGGIIGQYKGFNVYLRGSENFKYSSFGVEVGYWRKANHIHNWFVKNVQNGTDECDMYEVNKEKLIELRDVCKEVINNTTKAESLLPTQSGFFFGGVEYDELYFTKTQTTIDIINKVLEETDFEKDMITYRSSW